MRWFICMCIVFLGFLSSAQTDSLSSELPFDFPLIIRYQNKLVRYNQALSRFRKAAEIVKEEIILFLIITLIFTFLSAAGIYYFENEAQPEIFSSIFSSFWWAIVTLTTVGYGDVYPITVGGKIFTFFVLLIGVGIVTIPAGLVASALQKAREIEDDHK
jgi:voltage-gated potassium channel